MTSLKIILSAFLITAGLIKGAAALAETAPQGISIVRTADLDLNTKAGRTTLEHRLVLAAHDVCGTAADVDVAGKNDVQQCRLDVLAKAHADIQQLASRDGSVLIAARR